MQTRPESPKKIKKRSLFADASGESSLDSDPPSKKNTPSIPANESETDNQVNRTLDENLIPAPALIEWMKTMNPSTINGIFLMHLAENNIAKFIEMVQGLAAQIKAIAEIDKKRAYEYFIDSILMTHPEQNKSSVRGQEKKLGKPSILINIIKQEKWDLLNIIANITIIALELPDHASIYNYLATYIVQESKLEAKHLSVFLTRYNIDVDCTNTLPSEEQKTLLDVFGMTRSQIKNDPNFIDHWQLLIHRSKKTAGEILQNFMQFLSPSYTRLKVMAPYKKMMEVEAPELTAVFIPSESGPTNSTSPSRYFTAIPSQYGISKAKKLSYHGEVESMIIYGLERGVFDCFIDAILDTTVQHLELEKHSGDLISWAMLNQQSHHIVMKLLQSGFALPAMDALTHESSTWLKHFTHYQLLAPFESLLAFEVEKNREYLETNRASLLMGLLRVNSISPLSPRIVTKSVVNGNDFIKIAHLLITDEFPVTQLMSPLIRQLSNLSTLPVNGEQLITEIFEKIFKNHSASVEDFNDSVSQEVFLELIQQATENIAQIILKNIFKYINTYARTINNLIAAFGQLHNSINESMSLMNQSSQYTADTKFEETKKGAMILNWLRTMLALIENDALAIQETFISAVSNAAKDGDLVVYINAKSRLLTSESTLSNIPNPTFSLLNLFKSPQLKVHINRETLNTSLYCILSVVAKQELYIDFRNNSIVVDPNAIPIFNLIKQLIYFGLNFSDNLFPTAVLPFFIQEIHVAKRNKLNRGNLFSNTEENYKNHNLLESLKFLLENGADMTATTEIQHDLPPMNIFDCIAYFKHYDKTIDKTTECKTAYLILFERYFLEHPTYRAHMEKANSELLIKLKPKEITPLHENANSTHTSAVHASVSKSATNLKNHYFANLNATEVNNLIYKTIFEIIWPYYNEHAADVVLQLLANNIVNTNNVLTIEVAKSIALFSRPYIAGMLANRSYMYEKLTDNELVWDLPSYRAIRFIATTLQKYQYTDPVSKITLYEELTLVWLGIHDDKIYPSKDRQAELERNLGLHFAALQIESSEYNADSDIKDYPACPSGCFNGFMEVLDKQNHPCVEIIQVSSDKILHFIVDFYQAKFKQLSESERQAVIQSCQPESVNSELIYLISENFMQRYKDEFLKSLQNYISQGYLSLQQIEGFLNSPFPLRLFKDIARYQQTMSTSAAASDTMEIEPPHRVHHAAFFQPVLIQPVLSLAPALAAEHKENDLPPRENSMNL